MSAIFLDDARTSELWAAAKKYAEETASQIPKGDKGDKGDPGDVPANNPVFTGSISMGRAEGTAVGENSAAVGMNCDASSFCSHAEGNSTTASGPCSHSEGEGTCANGYGSHAEGTVTNASGDCSHAEGTGTIAGGDCSHSEGEATNACSYAAHSEGAGTVASGDCSHAEGTGTCASNYASHAGGKYNKAMTDGGDPENKVGDVMALGNGTCTYDESTDTEEIDSSNCFRVTYAGEVYGLAAFNSSGADYAEFFQWWDGNPDAEDRVGYFVTLEGREIRLAGSGDYILGIVSGQPCIIGNADEDWLGRWAHDDFGRFVREYLEEERTEIPTEGLGMKDIDILLREPGVEERDGKLYRVTSKVVDHETPSWRHKANPDYDPSQTYIERKDRPEWSAVGMLGVLSVRDDGTCQPGGFCRVAEGGTATAAEAELTAEGGKVLKGWRVIERVSGNVIKIVFR